MGRDWDGAKGHPKPSPLQGRVGFKYSQCEGLSCKSGLGVSGLALPEFRMLQLKPQERQGEGRQWVLLQTHSAGMGEEPEDLGSQTLPSSSSSGRVQVGSASITHIQHSTVLLSTAASRQPAGMHGSSPSLPGAQGSHSGHIPPSFCPCQGVFCSLWPPARGKGRGSVSVTVGSRRGRRVPTLLPSASVPRAASHPAWGPGKRRGER